MDRRRLVLFGLAFVFSFAPVIAHARRGRVRIGGRGLDGKGGYGQGVLTPDQLSACLRSEAEINQMADMIDEREVLLGQKQIELKKLGDELDRIRSRLDTTSQRAVGDYNRKVEQHRRMTADFNKSIPEHNNRVDRLNTHSASFNTNCAGKNYYDSDMKEVRNKLNLGG